MAQTNHFSYRWWLKDGFPAPNIEKHNYKVFGTFSCGGGSSMGFKLAGYDVLGGVEIDPRTAAYYKNNLHPQYFYELDIREFNKLPATALPPELFDLDVLEGSPPCSTFSLSGLREKSWGKKKRFAEGQVAQRLDDLIFVYADTILKLRPKVFTLENVAGLLLGRARAYVKALIDKLAGDYDLQIFDLNGANMGLPQMRERVFVIGHRKDFSLPPLSLDYHEEPVKFREICEGENTDPANAMTERERWYWDRRIPSDLTIGAIARRLGEKPNGFGVKIVKLDRIPNTVIAQTRLLCYDYPRALTLEELRLASSFPQDYQCPAHRLAWVMGMSVPPLMMANIALEIKRQWLDKINASS